MSVAPAIGELFALWRELQQSRPPRVMQLGALFVPREDPRLVVCDPAFVATATPFARRLAEGIDSIWNVSILVDAGVVVAALASRAVTWRQVFAPPGPRTYGSERGEGAKTERWEISFAGAEVTERTTTKRGERRVSSKTARDSAAAFTSLQKRAERKIATGFREITPDAPPTRWELAGDFAVDYARTMITDASSAAKLRASVGLRSALERRSEGPPGLASLDDGACDIVHFSSGRGDGRYRAFWGEDDAGIVSALLVPFVPELSRSP